MSRVMVTLELEKSKASFDQVKRVLGLSDSQVDAEFGLVNISPDEHLYTILVDEDAAERLQGKHGVRGVYSNPKIEPFGPPEK